MPTELYIAGKLPARRIPAVAIIGSRRPTTYGKEVTYRFAYDLAKRGVIIISGLAYGIDAVAHQAALDAGGTTVAVMAQGLHRVYPAEHFRLAQDIIAAGGALVSEQALGVEAHKYHFLARNRLVSGLADAVIVTEATDRSGTVSTVTHALSQNKEVFAVPGHITSLLSVGPNRLLQQGAHVALEVRDILEVIAPGYNLPGEQTSIPLGDTPLEASIITAVQGGIHDGELLQKVCAEAHDVSAGMFLQTLTMMELKGTLRSLGGNQWGLGM